MVKRRDRETEEEERGKGREREVTYFENDAHQTGWVKNDVLLDQLRPDEGSQFGALPDCTQESTIL
jgi:hypothetical protein